MQNRTATTVGKSILTGLAALIVILICPLAVQAQSGARVNTDQVRVWNEFADSLLRIHEFRIQTRKTRQIVTVGGYARLPEFYREVETRDAKSGRILSRIRWERANPNRLHTIELMLHDERGRVSVDYVAAYLVKYRNAPFQTLINVHYYDDDLHAYRQFDASGVIIFERCEGTHFGETVDLSLEEPIGPPSPHIASAENYTACFGLLPLTGDDYLIPEERVPGLRHGLSPKLQRTEDDENSLVRNLAQQIETSGKDAALYVRRGDALFNLQRFAEAVADYDRALELDDGQDRAYFGRGMAYGRMGELDRGIADLTIFLERNPTSSLGYTKRGVRYIWQRDFERAHADLIKAVQLDDRNAEAHDDLGVVLAQKGALDKALRHLLKARALDPGYQKVHHNLAMVRYMRREFDQALDAADDALSLNPDVKDTLLLKAVILDGLGRSSAATATRERANRLSAGNWSERSSIR